METLTINRATWPPDQTLETQVNLITPSSEQSYNWPGQTATANVYASSGDDVHRSAWRFGDLEVAGSGSMPLLEGYSRHLALLEGEGLLIMHGNDDRTELLEQGENGAMSMASANEVELIEGPVRLLDIVVDDSKYSTSAFILGDEENMHDIEAELLIIYGLRGERMHCILDEHEFSLNEKQWMRIDNPPNSELQCTDGRVLVLAVKAI